MAGPLPRRFYDILSKSMYSLIVWLLVLVLAITLEGDTKAFNSNPQQSFTFFLLSLPLYSVVLFGCYSLISIGYHLFILEDCKDAQDELLLEI